MLSLIFNIHLAVFHMAGENSQISDLFSRWNKSEPHTNTYFTLFLNGLMLHERANFFLLGLFCGLMHFFL